MAVKIQTIDESFEDNGLKILVHGLAGIGKTILCATTNRPTLIINCEGGLLSLKNAVKNGFVTKEQMRMIRTVKVQSIGQLREVYSMLLNREFPCEWVGLDSITEIAEVVLATAKKDSKDPRKSYGDLIEAMTQLIKDFRDLAYYNVLMTCKQEKFIDSVTQVTTYVPSMPGAKLGPQIPYLFDEVFAMREFNVEVVEGKYEMRRVLQTNREMQYEAKDRSGVLNIYEPPNIAHIAAKINNSIADESQEVAAEEVEEVEEEIQEVSDATDE
jgi:hypothetical protein